MMAIFRRTHQIDHEESAKAREEREPVDSDTNNDIHDLPAFLPLDESGVTLSGGENAVGDVQIETVEIGMGKQSVESVETGVTPREPTERVAIWITLEERDEVWR